MRYENTNYDDTRSHRWILVSMIVVLGIGVLALAIYWQIGLFDIHGSESDAKIISAVIALLGTLLVQVVALIGLMVKSAYDDRSLRLQKEEQERRWAETAIRAIDLLGASNGSDVPSTQLVGVMHALATLGHCDLALALVSQIWDEIGSAAAVLVINEALNSPDERLQEWAANALNNHAADLVNDDLTFEWPRTFIARTWNTRCSTDARVALASSLVEMILSKPAGEWPPASITLYVEWLNMILKRDREPRVQAACSIALLALLRLYRADDPVRGSENAVQEVVSKTRPDATVITLDHESRLNKWVAASSRQIVHTIPKPREYEVEPSRELKTVE